MRLFLAVFLLQTWVVLGQPRHQALYLVERGDTPSTWPEPLQAIWAGTENAIRLDKLTINSSGTAEAPSLRFASDLATGFFYDGGWRFALDDSPILHVPANGDPIALDFPVRHLTLHPADLAGLSIQMSQDSLDPHAIEIDRNGAEGDVIRYTSFSNPLFILDSTGQVTAAGLLRSTAGFQSTGGNPRGTNATDLQVTRTNVANVASGTGSVISGGSDNRANDSYATVGGGFANSAADAYSTVSGGYINQAREAYATVGGGYANVADEEYSTVAGGAENTAAAPWSVVAGGLSNSAINNYTAILGGLDNLAEGVHGAITGGLSNYAGGEYSTVLGGRSNEAHGDYSIVAGRRAIASHQGTAVFSDSTDADIASTAANQFIARYAGGVHLPSATTAAAGLTLATDVQLYRSAANTLRTPDAMTIDGNMVNSAATAHGWVSTGSASLTLSNTYTYWGFSRSNLSTVAVTLYAANSVPAGTILILHDTSGAAGTNPITITRAGSDTINGATNTVINSHYGVVRLVSNGSNAWYIW